LPEHRTDTQYVVHPIDQPAPESSRQQLYATQLTGSLPRNSWATACSGSQCFAGNRLSMLSIGENNGHQQVSCRDDGRNKLGRAVISQPGVARTPPVTNDAPKNNSSALVPRAYCGCVTNPKPARPRSTLPRRTRNSRPKNKGR
jgi:hypothetical protein